MMDMMEYMLLSKFIKNIRILVQAMTNACALNAYMKS